MASSIRRKTTDRQRLVILLGNHPPLAVSVDIEVVRVDARVIFSIGPCQLNAGSVSGDSRETLRQWPERWRFVERSNRDARPLCPLVHRISSHHIESVLLVRVQIDQLKFRHLTVNLALQNITAEIVDHNTRDGSLRNRIAATWQSMLKSKRFLAR